MSLDTYDGLRAEVADWLNKTNLTAQIPSFVRLCEAQMKREITTIGHIDNYADVEVGADGWALSCSARDVKSVSFGGEPLPYISPDRVGEITSNCPSFFTIDGNTLRVAPGGTVTIRLAKDLCPLSSSVKCNWLLREHPDAYLYGSLMQAAPYLRDDDRISVWGDLYASAILSINRHEVARSQGGYLRMQSGATP